LIVWDRDQPHERRERLFGGAGAVLVWNLCGDGPRPPFGAILACELEPSSSVGPHVQQQLAEVVIVIEGEGVATVGGAPVSLRPGTVVELALGRTLTLENVSREQSLRYLIVKAK
jgi:mannose-6-phosphate isomerase-like protein (cupin superfamily)